MSLRSALNFQSDILTYIRDTLRQKGAAEVHTPTLLQYTVAHPTTRVFTVTATAEDIRSQLYLQPSPELAMRELISEGSGQIFQICRAYRDEPEDATHCREFLLLEWYVPGISYKALAEEVCRLLSAVVARPRKTTTCADLFQESYGVPLHEMDETKLFALQSRIFGDINRARIVSEAFDHLLAHAAERIAKDTLLCIFDYPVHDPCFGRLSSLGHIERFEILLDGIEIANGYQEIESATAFMTRFEYENMQRAMLGETELSLIQAKTIPECSGVAIGLQRLFSIAAKSRKSLLDQY